MAQPKLLSRGSLLIALATLVLTGCTGMSDEVGKIEPVTFEDLDALFEAVDDELACPEASSDRYGFTIPNHEHDFFYGHTCGDSIILAHSEDPTVITEIQNMMATVQGGSIPLVHNTNWLIMDITEVAEDGDAANLDHPESRDLEELAASWGAAYSVF